ncbi:MAG: metallophosphoesterase [Planctomycetota bacterium]
MADRRIFVGDLQGCRAEFEDLLEAVGYDPGTDSLHPVGDLVNRGPDSLGALRLCRELGTEPVLGNHDVHLLRQWRDPAWRGRRDTLESILAADDGQELLGWLESLPLALGWDDVVCVHAGIHPRWSDPVAAVAGRSLFDPDDDAVEFVVRARYCDDEGRMPRGGDWPPPGAPFRPWDELWRARTDESRTVVFGHWARRGIVDLERTRGLDAGCVYGGELAAWIAEEDRIVRVPARRVWYETA